MYIVSMEFVARHDTKNTLLCLGTPTHGYYEFEDYKIVTKKNKKWWKPPKISLKLLFTTGGDDAYDCPRRLRMALDISTATYSDQRTLNYDDLFSFTFTVKKKFVFISINFCYTFLCYNV